MVLKMSAYALFLFVMEVDVCQNFKKYVLFRSNGVCKLALFFFWCASKLDGSQHHCVNCKEKDSSGIHLLQVSFQDLSIHFRIVH